VHPWLSIKENHRAREAEEEMVKQNMKRHAVGTVLDYKDPRHARLPYRGKVKESLHSGGYLVEYDDYGDKKVPDECLSAAQVTAAVELYRRRVEKDNEASARARAVPQPAKKKQRRVGKQEAREATAEFYRDEVDALFEKHVRDMCCSLHASVDAFEQEMLQRMHSTLRGVVYDARRRQGKSTRGVRVEHRWRHEPDHVLSRTYG
jgi:hypothetical protein